MCERFHQTDGGNASAHRPGEKRTSDRRGDPCHARTLAPATKPPTKNTSVVFENYIITHRVFVWAIDGVCEYTSTNTVYLLYLLYYYYYMPTNIRVIRSTRSKSTCCYKYTRDNDHRSVVDVVTRAVYCV